MSNLNENKSDQSHSQEQLPQVSVATKLWSRVRNIFERHSSEEEPPLGFLILEANKDVRKFGRKPLWKGDTADFLENNKEIPISVITRELNGRNDLAFRAVSAKEFENIIIFNGIGGDNYKGTVVDDGTYFALELSAPLAMMDGRTYGGDDDRYRSGYLIVVKQDEVISCSNDASVQDVVKVVRKIPLDKLYAAFRIDREPPTYENIDYTYTISRIIPKPDP